MSGNPYLHVWDDGSGAEIKGKPQGGYDEAYGPEDPRPNRVGEDD